MRRRAMLEHRGVGESPTFEKLHNLLSAPEAMPRPPKQQAPVAGAILSSSFFCSLAGQGVWPPVGSHVERRGVRDSLDVAPVCVGGVDAFPLGAWLGPGEQSEGDLPTVRRPVGAKRPTEAADRQWDLRQARAVWVDDI